MSSDAPTPPLLVTASVSMQAPSFVPGSIVSATITLSAKPQRPLASSHSEHRHPPATSRHRPQLAQSASAASSMLASFQPSATARIDYVVAELSGRWTSDRSWLSPNVHKPVNPSIHLDNHTQAPQTSSSSFPPDAFLIQSPRHTANKSNAKKQQSSAQPSPPSSSSSLSSSISNAISSSANIAQPVSFDDPTLGPYAWSAALADANAVGGGGRPGHSGTIFRSHPIVVCEREQVPSNSQVSFCVDAILPDDIPPTFRGSAMRYGYALVIVVKFPEAPVPHVVRVPFRVLPVVDPLNLPYDESNAAGTDGNKPQSSSNLKQKRIAVPTPRDVGPRPNRFLQHEDITPLRMSSRLLKSAPPDDIEIALALSMNGRLTDYKPDVEHRQLTNDHDPTRTSTSDQYGLLMSPTSSGIDGMSSTPSLSSSSSASVLHYLPSSMNSEITLLPTTLGSHEIDINEESNLEEVIRQRRSLRVYSISKGKQSVAKVYLSKRVHHLGDTVQIMFDFHGDRACYQIGARLEMHEVVGARYSVGYQDGFASGGSGGILNSGAGGLVASASATAMTVAPVVASSASDSAVAENYFSDSEIKKQVRDAELQESDGVIFRKVFGDYGEFVTSARNAEITFSIPHDAPASFSTGVVCVRWMLHFVFVVPQGEMKDERIVNENGSAVDAEFGIDEGEELLRGLKVDEGEDANVDGTSNGDAIAEGWKGGPWRGEDSKFWTHIPDKDVDMLRWTLPIVVSGQPGSPWGQKNVNTITHVCAG